jgi:uncharacterized protein YodC (DUF2158 family)
MEKLKFCMWQTVKMRTGGDVMTIVGRPAFDWNPPSYICQWMARGILREGVFYEELLEPAAAEQPRRRKRKNKLYVRRWI